VILPNATRGDVPCASAEESWFVPSMNRSSDGSNPKAVVDEHNRLMDEYVQKKAADREIPHWWVKGQEINSKCPRAVDCPDFRYQGEQPYTRQITLLKSLGKVVDLNKVSIGFETLGIDVSVQMQGWEDHALPWSTSPMKAHKPPTPYNNYTYYKPCTHNMTVDNIKENKRCAKPLLSQQWGPKFDADEMLGLENAVHTQLRKDLAGVGFFTLDGVLSQKPGSARRYWHSELQKLNETYEIPCVGDACGRAGDDPWKPAPLPPSPHGSYTVQQGDTCYAIAERICQDGSSWTDVICNSASACKMLRPGQSLKYDCSSDAKHCSDAAEIFL
jgi:hypothetical protein